MALILAIAALILIILLVRNKSVYVKILLGILVLIALFGMMKVIEVDKATEDAKQVLSEIKKVCDESYVRAVDDEVQLKINDSWYNIKKIKVLEVFTDDIVLDYNGTKIYLGESGVVNTIKTLEKLGFLGDDKEK